MSRAEAGIHDPENMPFSFPWTVVPVDELPRRMAVHYCQNRAAATPDSWSLELVVRRDGEVVGVQELCTRDFPVTRTAETGSWLGQAHHGQGIGTVMRQVVCAFAFDGELAILERLVLEP